MGLPSASLTFSSWVSKLRTFTEIFFFTLKGFTNHRPGLRMVPM